MNRVIAGATGLLATALVVVGCSSAKDSEPTPAPAAQQTTVSTGSGTAVKVDGKDLPGLDLNSVTCVKQGGKINVASAAIGGQQGIGIVMTDEATPRVESLGMVVDGNALSVSDNMGVKLGSAKVSVDGDTYTIAGDAVGANLSNPMDGQINKPFTITVSCS